MSERTRSHEELQVDLAAYALGSLDPDDREALEAHLRDCAACREILAEYQHAVDHFPLAAPALALPDAARERLLERARAAAPRQPPAPTRNLRYLWGGFAAMAALLLVMLGWNIWLEFDAAGGELLDFDRIAIIIPLAGAEDAGPASGHLVMDAAWDDCALVASGLPTLSAERDYQLWFVRADGTRVSGAVFHPDDSGRITVEVDVPGYWGDLERVGVTEEPAGGSSEPTGRNVLRGAFGQGD